MADEFISARISNDSGFTLRSIDDRADELGMSRTQFVLYAVKMVLSYDKAFFKTIRKIADDLHIHESIVIQNTIIDEWARQKARAEIYGDKDEQVRSFPIVRRLEGARMLTGDELFNHLYNVYLQEFKTEKWYQDAEKAWKDDESK